MGIALPVVRMGIDMCSGHAEGPTYYPPRPALTGSVTVFIDGIPAVRVVVDTWAPHSNPVRVHTGVGVMGSTTVFVNGFPLMRIGDPLDCGSVAIMGSPTVFSG